MTRLDFYILSEDAAAEAGDLVACRLAGKAFNLGHAVYIHTTSPEHTARLDTLLWTFQQGSFVPHAPRTKWRQIPAKLPSPVLLGHEDDHPPAPYRDLLINTTDAVPACFQHYRRVAELVCGGDEFRRRARERYQFYRDGGFELHTHRL